MADAAVVTPRGPEEEGRAAGGADPAAPAVTAADPAAWPALRLRHRPPVALDSLLGYLARRAAPTLEEALPDGFRRTLVLPHGGGVVELRALPGTAGVEARLRLDDRRDAAEALARVRGVLDLDADPVAVDGVLADDPLLRPLVRRRPGLRVPGHVDGFELAARAVLHQQVSVAGALTTTARLVAALGTPLACPVGALTHRFPSPDALADGDLGGVGLPAGRVRALRALARAVREDGLELRRGTDVAAATAALLALPGIGPWTASYVALRALGDADALPVADLGLRRALERLGEPGDPVALARRAERWRPFRGYAAVHLWTTLLEEPAGPPPPAGR